WRHACQKAVRVERCEKRTTFFEPAQAVEAHGIKPLEYVLALAMRWRAAVGFGETLDFLEARDDAFLACATAAFLFLRGEVGEVRRQFVKIEVIRHSAPPS